MAVTKIESNPPADDVSAVKRKKNTKSKVGRIGKAARKGKPSVLMKVDSKLTPWERANGVKNIGR